MPNGATHSKATFICALTLPSTLYIASGSPEKAFMLFAGCAAGLLVTPDLDVDGGNYSAYILKVVGGEVASKVWVFLWSPYSKLMPHRSPWSHSPILSTAIRMLYVAVLMAPLLFASYLVSGLNTVTLREELLQFIPFFAGLAIVDTLHIVMDVTTTTIKRRF